MRCLRLTLATCLLLLATTASAQAGWRNVGGQSPINESGGARVPEMTTIGAVPYVAYYGYDGENHEVRVKRLGLLGLGWHDVGSGSSPINRDAHQNGVNPSIASVGGVPHVAWLEWDGTNYQARASRLDVLSGEWEELVGGPSPLNRNDEAEAWWVSIADVGGVPYVTWIENQGPVGNQTIKVSRLSEDGSAWEPVGGQVQRDGTSSAYNSRIVAIDGAPWIVWEEWDGCTHQVRVGRLTDEGDWEEVGGGSSPINHDPCGYAIAASLAEVGGVPHVAWSEYDGANYEARVSRLDERAGEWEEVVGGPSPLNYDSSKNAFWTTSITDYGGRPWVTWTEFTDDFNLEVRVSRLSVDGTQWKPVGRGPSPMPHESHMRAQEASMTIAAGLPYVARVEAGPNVEELRISRLEPDLLEAIAIVNELGATLVARLRTYGVEYPVDFAYGAGSALDLRTPAVRTESGEEEQTVRQALVGLTPGASYSWRPEALGGSLPLGAAQSFRIPLLGEVPELPDPDLPDPDLPDPDLPDPDLPDPDLPDPDLPDPDLPDPDLPDPDLPDPDLPDPDVPGPELPDPPGLPQPPQPDLPVVPGIPELPLDPATPEVPGLPELSVLPKAPDPEPLRLSVLDAKLKAPADPSVKVRYLATQAADVRLEIRRGKRLVATVAARSKPGKNGIRWNGRHRGERAKPGLYTLTLRASAAGGSASDSARVRVKGR